MIKNKKRYHDYSQVDEDEHEIEDLQEQYEKEEEEIENSTKF